MPRIGLLSDSHGRHPTTQRGVASLMARDAEVLIHLGDVGTVEVIDALAVEHPHTGDQIPARLVFGNTDWDLRELTEYAEDLGIVVDHPAGRLPLDLDVDSDDPANQLAFCHGHEASPMEKALADGVRYLCHGHTHRTLDVRKANTRVINPGALFRARQYTVALLDTEQDDLEIIDVGETAASLK